MILAFTRILEIPDWSPAAFIALLIIIALLSISGTMHKRAPSSKVNVAMFTIICILAYVGVFALVRMVV